jgi:V8-like Glu-specific endopeptidase
MESLGTLNTVSKSFKEGSNSSLWNPNVLETKAGRIIEGASPTKKVSQERIALLPTGEQSIESRYEFQYNQGYYEEEKVMPGDGRTQIKDTNRWPNSIHVYLETKFESASYHGSGVMIGPFHVLTCAHNVYDNKRNMWANEIHASPGANEDKAPFGRCSVAKVFILQDWELQNQEADLALLVLESDVGYYTGWASFGCWEDAEFDDILLYVSGYPGDKTAKSLWEMKGEIISKAENVLRYKVSTFPGQSGSGVWRKGAFPYVAGVHVRGADTHNEATRLSPQYFDWLKACMNQDFPPNVGVTKRVVNLDQKESKRKSKNEKYDQKEWRRKSRIDKSKVETVVKERKWTLIFFFLLAVLLIFLHQTSNSSLSS